MRVAVLGGGVIGVTSAWYLAQAGAEVEVIERQPGAALETSFANAGEISPGYASPWAGPGMPLKALKWLFEKHSPLVVRPQWDPAMWLWILRMLRNCTAGFTLGGLRTSIDSEVLHVSGEPIRSLEQQARRDCELCLRRPVGSTRTCSSHVVSGGERSTPAVPGAAL